METFCRDKFEKVEERSQRLDRTGEKLEDNDAVLLPQMSRLPRRLSRLGLSSCSSAAPIRM
jgi:hypothetical protein